MVFTFHVHILVLLPYFSLFFLVILRTVLPGDPIGGLTPDVDLVVSIAINERLGLASLAFNVVLVLLKLPHPYAVDHFTGSSAFRADFSTLGQKSALLLLAPPPEAVGQQEFNRLTRRFFG